MFDQLKKWLSGDATWKAEQKLDQAAAKDDFLADALEGYRSMPEGDHARTVKSLKARLPGKSSINKGGFSFQKIAAAAAIVLAIGAFFWLQRDISKPGELANATKTQEREEMSPSAPAVEKSLDEDANNKKEEEINESDKDIQPEGFIAETEPNEEQDFKRNRSNLKVDPSNIEAGVIDEDDIVGNNQEEVADNVTADVATVDAFETDTMSDMVVADMVVEDAENPTVILKEEAASYSSVEAAPTTASPEPPIAATIEAETPADKEKSKNNSDDENAVGGVSVRKIPNPSRFRDANALSGRVLDASTDEGIIGASIYIRETGEGVIADFDGSFILQSDTKLPWTIVISYLGYNEEEVFITSLDNVYVVSLKEADLVLEQVVVSGSRARKKSQRSKDMTKSPEPATSFKKLKKYIGRKMKYPEDAKQNSIEGEVTVQFYINAEGKPEEFTILKSLGHGCDEEAIRLLKEGPKWKPANRYTSYTVEFKL